MGSVARLVAGELLQRMRGPAGLAASVEAMGGETAVCDEQIVDHAGAGEVLERLRVRYPLVVVHCERLKNTLRERFRSFSGTAEVWVEVRCSGDVLDEVSGTTRMLADAVVDVLDRNRGEWTPGVMHTGAYEVAVGPVKLGGRCFVQTARVSVELQVSAG